MSARRAMLAKLHLARRDLALTEDTYRDVLRRVTGQDSAAALSEPQLDKALREFRRLGWKPRSARTGEGKESQQRMILAVWRDICALGIEAGEDGEAAALRAFVGRQTRTLANPMGVSEVRFLDSRGANKVLEGLKAWRSRLRRQVAA